MLHDADAAVLLLRGQADAQRRHAELGRRVGDAAQRRGPLAGDGVDVDDQRRPCARSMPGKTAWMQ